MSVVRRSAQRRWATVAGGVAVLCLLPALIAALPAPGVRADADRLRVQILASAALPYQGYAESRGRLGLPELPGLRDVAGLLGGTVRMRAWYASPRAWRVALVDLTGERDLYQTADDTYGWDFERNVSTHVVGDLPARLPWVADFTPPDLARRLVRNAAPGDSATAIGSRRVAGVVAAGLRLVPADPATTVGRVDIWADPATGLPLQVEATGRGGGRPVFTSRFLELQQRAPDPAVLRPALPPTASLVTTQLDASLVLDRVAPLTLPASVAGRALAGVPARISGVGAYGAGWSRFVVLNLPRWVGFRSMQAARNAGGAAFELAGGEGVEVRASLLTAVIVRSGSDRLTRRTYLLAGLVDPDLLRRAAADLLAHQVDEP